MGNRGPRKDKAQVRLEAAEDLERRYQDARERLLIAKNVTAKDFYPTLSQQTFKRIVDGASVDTINKERLIELMGGGGVSSNVYRGISSLIGQTRKKRDLSAAICGKYRYFRQDGPPIAGEAELSEGRIEIFSDRNGDIAFHHWPPDLDENAEPEHKGYAFLADGKLFMLGWKPGVLRLGIAHRSENCDGVMTGYVLSVRSVGGGNPIFSAPSVLVSEEREDELERFRGEGRRKHFSKHHPGHLPDYQSI